MESNRIEDYNPSQRLFYLPRRMGSHFLAQLCPINQRQNDIKASVKERQEKKFTPRF